MRINRTLAAALCVAALLSTTASAGVTTFRQGVDGYTGAEDTWLNDSDVHDNYGAHVAMVTGVDAAGLTRRDTAAIKFDLSGYSVPAGEVVQSAVLSLWAIDNWQDNAFNLNMHRALFPFAYGNGTGAGFGWGQATMSYNSFNNARWGNGTGTSNFDGPIEGIGANSDFVATPDATTVMPTGFGAAATLVTIDITSLVNFWIANPGVNYGAFIIPERNAGLSGATFRTSDSPFTHQNPLLTITTVPIPEPASLSLMAIGGLMMLRRR